MAVFWAALALHRGATGLTTLGAFALPALRAVELGGNATAGTDVATGVIAFATLAWAALAHASHRALAGATLHPTFAGATLTHAAHSGAALHPTLTAYHTCGVPLALPGTGTAARLTFALTISTASGLPLTLTHSALAFAFAGRALVRTGLLTLPHSLTALAHATLARSVPLGGMELMDGRCERRAVNATVCQTGHGLTQPLAAAHRDSTTAVHDASRDPARGIRHGRHHLQIIFRGRWLRIRYGLGRSWSRLHARLRRLRGRVVRRGGNWLRHRGQNGVEPRLGATLDGLGLGGTAPSRRNEG
jgi:hypothetical protein